MPTITNIFEQINTEKTTAQVIAEELKEMCNNGARQLLELHQQPFNKLWVRTRELGIDPQDVLNELGSDGEKIFTLASELITFILGGYGNTKIADMNTIDYVPPYSYSLSAGKIILNK